MNSVKLLNKLGLVIFSLCLNMTLRANAGGVGDGYSGDGTLQPVIREGNDTFMSETFVAESVGQCQTLKGQNIVEMILGPIYKDSIKNNNYIIDARYSIDDVSDKKQLTFSYFNLLRDSRNNSLEFNLTTSVDDSYVYTSEKTGSGLCLPLSEQCLQKRLFKGANMPFISYSKVETRYARDPITNSKGQPVKFYANLQVNYNDNASPLSFLHLYDKDTETWEKDPTKLYAPAQELADCLRASLARIPSAN